MLNFDHSVTTYSVVDGTHVRQLLQLVTASSSSASGSVNTAGVEQREAVGEKWS